MKSVNITSQIIISVIGLIIPFVWLYPFNKIHKISRIWNRKIQEIQIV